MVVVRVTNKEIGMLFEVGKSYELSNGDIVEIITSDVQAGIMGVDSEGFLWFFDALGRSDRSEEFNLTLEEVPPQYTPVDELSVDEVVEAIMSAKLPTIAVTDINVATRLSVLGYHVEPITTWLVTLDRDTSTAGKGK